MKRTLLLIVPILALLILPGTVSSSSAAELTEMTPLAPSALAPSAATDGRGGMCYSFYPDGGSERPYMPLAYDAGSRWDRFDFVWPRLEPSEGNWSNEALQAYDTLVDDLDGAGFNMVGILLWTPDWAATGGTAALAAPKTYERPPGWYAPVPGAVESLGAVSVASAASSPPRGLYEAWNDWTTGDGDPINTWGRFVYKVVERYGDRVKHWEMWNEPEWTYFWTGSSSDYARLLKVGYRATKAACSDCEVLFGGLHYWANQDYYKWVLNVLEDDPEAAASNYFFDVMSVHLYSRSSNTYEVVNEIRSDMRRRVSDHPVWLTETGVPVWDDRCVDPDPNRYDYAARQEEAAAYAIQSYANAWASGVERYFFFRTHDADMVEYFGLVRNDRSVRPAYAAYQVATTYLVRPTMVTNWTYGDGTRRVTLWGTPRGKVSVLWNTTPSGHVFDYPATLPSARVIDRRGGEEMVEARDGVYRVSLPGATANLQSDPEDYLIGGEPYLVVEEDTVPPSKAVVDPLPATSDSSTVTIHCSASDDAAGIWGYEVELQKDGGAWERWGSLRSAPIAFTGEEGATYCFRVRAWDRAGNPGPWADQEPCTTLGPTQKTRTVQVEVTSVFGDQDGNGMQGDEKDEPTMSGLTFRFVDERGRDVVTGSGSSWAFTEVVDVGDYVLVVTPADWPSFFPPGWLPRHLPVTVGDGDGTLTLNLGAVGLLPHRSSLLFPIVARDG